MPDTTTIKEHLERLDVSIPEQFGFREGELMRLVESISEAGSSSEQTVAFFLDVEQQPFDRVWHDGLLLKFEEIHIPDCYRHLIASFLRNRTFRVRVDDALSQERRITAGVPEGSVLEPLLFSAYVNDTPKLPGVKLSMFADDTAAYAVDQNAGYAACRLQCQLDAHVS